MGKEKEDVADDEDSSSSSESEVIGARTTGASRKSGKSSNAKKTGGVDVDIEKDSQESERERQRLKKEQEAAERRARRKKQLWRMVTAPCRFWNKFCSRRRMIRTQKGNKKVIKQLTDRLERRMVLKLKRDELDEEKRANWFDLVEKHKMTRRRRSWLSFKLSWRRLLEHIWDEIADLLYITNHETGLPRKLVENWTFKKLLRDSRHGLVYQAVDLDGRDCVIKIRDKSRLQVLKMPMTGAYRTLRREGLANRGIFALCDFGRCHRLLLRCGLIKEFNHPHLVDLHAVFNSREFYIEVSEFMEGPALSLQLQDMKKQLHEVDMCKVFSQIMSAVLYLHERRLIHRDIRVGQIILTKEGKEFDAKLSDFWCIMRVSKHRVCYEPFNPVDITTCAPEVVKHGEWTEKADVWASGCLLFEMLHGHPPYGGAGHALAQRVLQTKPEHDHYCGMASSSMLELLGHMLQRDLHQRPSVKHLMQHRWFQEFATKEALRQRKPHRIFNIKSVGTPLFRRGMHPENLLATQTGMFTAGFCSYMGDTHCSLDFFVGGPEEWKMYWVTSIRIALWGNLENPQSVSLLMAYHKDGDYHQLLKKNVEAATQTEVELNPNRPIAHVRLYCSGNFAGHMGIALRKLGFYGYEVRPISVAFAFNKCQFVKGAACYLHDEEITEHRALTAVHKSITNFLEKGERIIGSGARYLKYRDLCSGPEFSQTVISCPLKVDTDKRITAAVLALRYHCYCPPHSTPPRVKIYIEIGNDGKRVQLFLTSQLPPTKYSEDQILKEGYQDLPPIYVDGLDIPTDDGDLHIEMQFDNGAGQVHCPREWGLTFYYLPDIPSPPSSSDSEAEEEAKAAADAEQALAKNQLADLVASNEADMEAYQKELRLKAERDAAAAAAAAALADDDSDHYQSECDEKALQADLQYMMEEVSTYGAWGASVFDSAECDDYRPGAELEQEIGMDGQLHYHIAEKKEAEPWWESPREENEEMHEGEDSNQEVAASKPAPSKGTAGVSQSEATETTCPATLDSSMLTTTAGTQARTDSRVTPQSRETSRPDPGVSLDAWGEIDEWEEPEYCWTQKEYDGPTDAWGVPIDDEEHKELERLEQEQNRIKHLAQGVTKQDKLRVTAEGRARMDKLRFTSKFQKKAAAEALQESSRFQLPCLWSGGDFTPDNAV